MLAAMDAAAGRIEIEIAVQSLGDACAALAAGADRLELATGLEVGGLTPSTASVRELCRASQAPVVALVRPRAGGFCYDEAEWTALLHDVEEVMDNGAAAVAVGVLCVDGAIDVRRCAKLRRATEGAALVFHRAFDLAPDPEAALDALVSAGVDRVLTSGGARSVAPPSPGAAVVARLIERAGDRIAVVPAGGIRAANVAALLRATQCRQVHAACTQVRVDPSAGRPHAPYGFGVDADDGAYLGADAAQVAALRAAVDAAAARA